MDSINKNQEGDHQENLTGQQSIAKIKELVDSAKTCFFCTDVSTGDSSGTRPMSVQDVDDAGNLWFLSAIDSHKNLEVEKDNDVTLYFQGSPRSDFLMLRGKATITTNREIIEELWKPIVKVWFTEGKDDPRVSVIMVRPTDGYYWDTKHGMAVAGIKMLIGTMTGKTMDDSVEGTITV